MRLPTNLARQLRDELDPLVRKIVADELAKRGGGGVVPTDEGGFYATPTPVILNPDATVDAIYIELENASDYGAKFETLSLTIDIPNTAAHTVGFLDVEPVDVDVGDSLWVMGPSETEAGLRPFIIRPLSPVTVNDRITLLYFNADAIARNPDVLEFEVGCIHRSR